MTPQERKVMELALEALLKTQNEGFNLPGSAIREAITAIKEALAQPEQEQSGFFSREAMKAHSDGHMAQPEDKKCENCGEFGECCQDAQPEQDPENRCVRELREFAKSNQGAYIFPSWDGHRVLKYLGNTTLPQRKPLTDEDIFDNLNSVFGDPKHHKIPLTRGQIIDFGRKMFDLGTRPCTTPPQRTTEQMRQWVGLTDEQMQFLATAIGQAKQIIDTYNTEFVTARDDLRRCSELLAAVNIKE